MWRLLTNPLQPSSMTDLFDMALIENGRGILFTQPSGIHGSGLFTSRDLPANTIICRRLGLRSVLSLRDKRAILGIDGLDPATPEDFLFKFINHSCHPNTYLSDTGCLVSLEAISDQNEITIDYVVLLSGSPWKAVCHCGLMVCRGNIGSIFIED